MIKPTFPPFPRKAEVARLRSLPYSEYLKSEHWQQTRKAMLRLRNYQCFKCGGSANLNVHHITYKNLGRESKKDLRVLCQPCHYRHHEICDPLVKAAALYNKQVKRNNRLHKLQEVEMHAPGYDGILVTLK